MDKVTKLLIILLIVAGKASSEEENRVGKKVNFESDHHYNFQSSEEEDDDDKNKVPPLLLPKAMGGPPRKKLKNVEDDSADDDDGIDDFNKNNQFQSSDIHSAFQSKNTFMCPRVKPALHTGDSTATISPEDIDIVSAIGGSLASGRGLWPPTTVEFRGAAFPIGGDANIDGLVTIPNILLEFNDNIDGESHGMGTIDQLPDNQYNTAISNASTTDLPGQAKELVRRLHKYETLARLRKRWVLVVIPIGTEEFCNFCSAPDHSSLRKTMGILRKGIPKALVVLIGPVHVASSYSLNKNLLQPRCKCLQSKSKTQYIKLVREYSEIYNKVQDEFNHLNYSTFAVLSIPQLTIHSRDPKSLFIDDEPLLNRKGHSYAAKWLWNRLMAGPNYNSSGTIFSEDAYFCPSVGCPYFRTVQNFRNCTITTEYEYQQILAASTTPISTEKPTRQQKMQKNLPIIIVVVVLLSAISVFTFGTIFYCHGLKATKGRFESLEGGV